MISCTFVNVTILNAEGPAGHTLRVRGGRVAALGDPPRPGDTVIDGGGGLLLPGLINAHDHLALNNFRRLKYLPCYRHAVEWFEDIEARRETDPALTWPLQTPLRERLLAGGLKNLLSGVTTVCHHNPLYRFLRSDFLIRVVKNYTFSHSLYRGRNIAATCRRTGPTTPWIIHLAEGVDAAAAQEFDILAGRGLIRPNTLLVHGVGLTPAQRQTLIRQGGGLIWCPASNYFLLGQTAQVQALAQAGKLALGSDSRLSGGFDLLDELRVAAFSNQLSARQLFAAVTSSPARLLRLPDAGRLTPGLPADLLLLPPPASDAPTSLYARLIGLTRSQLELVMLGGRPLVGSPQMAPLFAAAGAACHPVLLDGRKKLLSARVARRVQRISLLEPGLEFVKSKG